MALALPLVAYLSTEILRLARLSLKMLEMVREVAEGGLLMMPYLWLYFFALERLARRRRYELLPRANDR